MKILGFEIISKGDMASMREAMTLQRRALEDIGWVKVNEPGQPFNSLVRDSYVDMVKRSRLAFIKNPIVSHAVNLTTWYTFGQGVSTPKASDPNVQQIIDEFWADKDNRGYLTSEWAQMQVSNKLQYDGELALLLTVDVDGTMYARVTDPLTISGIVLDPTDPARVLFYKRRVKGQMNEEYIPDWQNGIAIMSDDPRYSGTYEELLKKLGIKKELVRENLLMYHVKTNCDILDVRGIPEVYRALDWINANNKINSDTATFINAQAQFAWSVKMKGTKSEIQKFRALHKQNENLTNPAKQAASMAAFNDKVDFNPIGLPSSTGKLFEIGIRRTLLMTCAAFGIMEHYFGDPSTGNLATATAMELPMLKKFQARQKMWETVFDDILQLQLDMKLMALNTRAFELNEIKNRIRIRKGRDYKDRLIDIDFPPILEEDLKEMADAMASAKNGQLVPRETAQRIFMQAAGINNIDEEIKKEFEEKPDPPPNPFGAQPTPPPDPAKESVTGKAKGVQTGRVKVAEVNRDMLRKVNGYMREIAGAFNALVKESGQFVEVFQKPSEKHSIRIDTPGIDKALESFITSMHKLAVKHYPRVVEVGESYARSQIPLKEKKDERLLEQSVDDLMDDLIDRNEKFLRTSLKPALRAKITESMLEDFATEAEALSQIRKNVVAAERRVGMYGSELWAVGQKAVKEAARTNPDQKANFIGVEDEGNCPGCTEALSGNPWNISRIPVPGEQDCMSNCRHAIQIAGDEDLTEADIAELRDAESEAKQGFRLLQETTFDEAYRKGEKLHT